MNIPSRDVHTKFEQVEGLIVMEHLLRFMISAVVNMLVSIMQENIYSNMQCIILAACNHISTNNKFQVF